MNIFLAVIRDSDEARVVAQLVNRDVRVTRMASTGGFICSQCC